MRAWAALRSAAPVLLGALPLLVTRPAPLQDWPNHVARIHILSGLLHGDPFWTQYYRLSGFLVPDVAFDLATLGLSGLGVPVEVAAQSFLIGTYCVFVGGFCMLAAALGAFGPAKPAFAVLLFYGNALFWGLVNYMLGAGLLLGLLALWLLAGRHAAQRLGVAGAGAALLLFTHVVAAVAWVVVLCCFGACRLLARRGTAWQRIADGASWLVALLTVGGLLHAIPGAGHDFRLVYAGGGAAGIAVRKLELFGRVLLGGSRVQDAASGVALLVCVAVAIVARPRLAAAPALTAMTLVVVTLGAPERMGTGSVLDTRLALLPLVLLAASLRITPGRLGTGLVLAAVMARTLVLAFYWHAAGQVFADFRRQAAGLPRGSVMMAAYATKLPSLSWQRVWSPAITSIATQAVFHDLFVPAIFANPAQQPIALRAAYQPLTQPWNLTDAADLHASASTLAALCARARFPGVYLTVLYPGTFLQGQLGAALLQARPDFLILDACRLRNQEPGN